MIEKCACSLDFHDEHKKSKGHLAKKRLQLSSSMCCPLCWLRIRHAVLHTNKFHAAIAACGQVMTLVFVELSLKWKTMGQSNFFTTSRKQQQTILLVFGPLKCSHDSEAVKGRGREPRSFCVGELAVSASEHAWFSNHFQLVEKRICCKLSTIEHAQRTTRKTSNILPQWCFLIYPPSSAHVVDV